MTWRILIALAALALPGVSLTPELMLNAQQPAADTGKAKAPSDTAHPVGEKEKSVSRATASPLALSIGVEVSSASAFDRTKVAPAIGFSALTDAFPIKANGVQVLNMEFGINAQLTQAATVREYRSCQRVIAAITGGPTPVDSLSGVLCKADQVSGDTTFRTLFRTDSVTFKPVSVWRAFAQGRMEAKITNGLWVGPFGGVGVQSNPNSLSDPRQQQLKLLGAIGVGVRQFTSEHDELFNLQVVYGAVQNYAQQDRLGATASDGTRTIITDALPVRRTQQWQAFLSLRPTDGFRLQAFFTFNAPPPNRLGEPPIPDLARIAFMTDRDLGDIIKALVGGQKKEDETKKTEEKGKEDGGKEGGKGQSTATERPAAVL
jgi:hypothetical protein